MLQIPMSADRGARVFAALKVERVRAPSEPASCVRIATVSDPAELADAWRDLAARTAGPTLYQSHAWCAAWVEACAAAGKPQDVRLVTAWEGERLVLLWPLCVRHLWGIGILHSLAEPGTQYCDALVEASPRAAEWLRLAWHHVVAERGVDLVHLHNVRTDARIRPLADQRLYPYLVSREAAPFLRLGPATAGFDEGPRARSGRSVNALKRHLKNLRKQGSVVCEVLPPALHVGAVCEALALKRQWLKARGAVSAGYDHPGNERAIRQLAQQGHFRVMRLSVDGITAALEIGALEKGYYYSLIQSYDPRYAVHAPGRLLLWQILADGEAAGIETFDFLPPCQPHKTEWTDVATGVGDYGVALTVRGYLALLYLRVGKGWLKRTFARLPFRLRIRLGGFVQRFY